MSRAPEDLEIVVVDDDDEEDKPEKSDSDSDIDFLYTCPPAKAEQKVQSTTTTTTTTITTTTIITDYGRNHPIRDSDITLCNEKKRKRMATKTVIAQINALHKVSLTAAPVILGWSATTPKNGDAVVTAAASLPCQVLTEAKKPQPSYSHKSTGVVVTATPGSVGKMARSSQQLMDDMTLKPGTPKLDSPRHQCTPPRGHLLSGNISEPEDSKSVSVVNRKINPLQSICESEDSKHPAMTPSYAIQDSPNLDDDSDVVHEPGNTQEEAIPAASRELSQQVNAKRPTNTPGSHLNASPVPPAIAGTGLQRRQTDAKISGAWSIVTSTSTQVPCDIQQDSHVDMAPRAASITGGPKTTLSSVSSAQRTGRLLKYRPDVRVESSDMVSGDSCGTLPTLERINEFNRKLSASASSRDADRSECVCATDRWKKLLRSSLRTSASDEDRPVLPQGIPSDEYLSSRCVEGENKGEQQKRPSDDAFWPTESPNGATADTYTEVPCRRRRYNRPGTTDVDSAPSKRGPRHSSTTRPSDESPSAMNTTRKVHCSESLSPDKVGNVSLPRHVRRNFPRTKKTRSSPDDSKNLENLIRRHWKFAKHENKSQHRALAKKLLEEKRDAVIRIASKQQASAGGTKFFPKALMASTIGATACKPKKGLVVTGCGNGKLPVPSILLVGADDPQPRHNNPIMLKKLYSTMDDKTLRFVPYFSEPNDEVQKILNSEYFDLSERQKRLLRGAPHREERSIQDTDLALQRICDELRDRDPPGACGGAKLAELRKLCNVFVKVARKDAGLFQERVDVLIAKRTQVSQKTTSGCAPQSDDDWNQYLQSADTYRKMFCNRCFVYDCNLHGQYEKPTAQLQNERARLREKDGYWEVRERVTYFFCS
jgi:hypothetical protein